MADKKKGGGDEEGPGIDPQGWMITFSDLLTLMLTFFVLLFSMSSLDAKSLKEMTQSDALAAPSGNPVRKTAQKAPPRKPVQSNI